MTALYNEIDPFAAQWVRNLIAAGHVAPGAVDERSIVDLKPADVAGPGQRHFFAGIAGWSYALRLAGVDDDADVWTGSCPCQPFSSAGKRGGFNDERHLWPVWFALIRECRPAIVFGEQVASPDGLAWFDAVHADLEAAGYAVGAADLCAAGVGAPHIRQRLYFVAYADREQGRLQLRARESRREDAEAGGRGEAFALAYAAGSGRPPRLDEREAGASERARSSDDRRSRRLVDTAVRSGRQRLCGLPQTAQDLGREPSRSPGEPDAEAGAHDGRWEAADWLPCIDGVSRPVEPGTFPLAHGVPGRVGRLRAYGNAIVPEVAATFVRAALEAA